MRGFKLEMSREQLRVEFADAWCGCGCPEEAWRVVRDVLALCPLYENRDALEQMLPNDGVQMIVLGLLDRLELIEHGGSIGGSWLTPKGEAALSALNKEAETDFVPLNDGTDELGYCIHGFDVDADHDCMKAPEPAHWRHDGPAPSKEDE